MIFFAGCLFGFGIDLARERLLHSHHPHLKKEVTLEEQKPKRVVKTGSYVGYFVIELFVIDNHEYIVAGTSAGAAPIHNLNCTFCKKKQP